MNKWKEVYKSKLKTPEEVAKTVKDGEKIFCGSGSCTPDALLDALFERADELKDVVFGGLIMLGPLYKVLQKEKIGNIMFDNYFATPLDRPALHEGICVHTPFHFSDMPRLAGQYGGYKKIYTQCSPMDDKGYLSAGVSGNFLDTLDWIDEIYLEVNEHQPRVHGCNFYHINMPQVKAVVENSHPVFALPPEEITDVDRAIADNIIDLIDDGSAVQLGIGALPNAIGEDLLQKKHLGCYTEMINDSFKSLFEAGVLDNSQKNFFPFQMNAFFAAGSQDLYDWLHDNPMICFTPISYNNSPYNVAKNNKMVAINSTLEIDINGQCCSEAIGDKQHSATGGQVDFTRGAWSAREGKAMIVTHSTAKDKEGNVVSKIVPRLKPGAPVTLTRTDVMYVATEYGVVNLRGKSLRERAQLLISIAHPDFKAELRDYAKEVKYFILPEHDPLG